MAGTSLVGSTQTKARGRIRVVEYKSKLESDYAAMLEVARIAGEILRWWYEPIRLRLADSATYKPDFGILLPDGMYELHETKGFWRPADRIRIKVAAETHPFTFRGITRNKDGAWAEERF